MRYQCELHAAPAALTVLSVPTGMGKTMAVLADWMERRPTTRLVWCLPGRALTSQVGRVAREMVGRLAVARPNDKKVRVLEVMGGHTDVDVKLEPDEPAILVGTQDVLVSRALNRGYLRSPFHWPIDFALLNNDVQWVFDEVQLLGEAVATGAQLAAFREGFGTFGAAPTVWISATLDPDWLRTVDQSCTGLRVVRVEPSSDHPETHVAKRLAAPKRLARAPEECRLPSGCAAFAVQTHRPGELTLVVVNTVARARAIHAEIERIRPELRPLLLHSQFRPSDRERQVERLFAAGNEVVIATQVVEAGLDLDAKVMISDVAPWPAMVQRFGRVNRNGNPEPAEIFWVNEPMPKEKPKQNASTTAPYEPAEVAQSAAILGSLVSAAIADLPKFQAPPPYKFVIRRADVVDLFDTTPDLGGNQLDIARFVRTDRDSNIYLAWREWEGSVPPRFRVRSRELCPVPMGADLDNFLKETEAWRWDATASGRWERAGRTDIVPGARLLLHSIAGGYSITVGWSPESKALVAPIAGHAKPAADQEEERSYNDNDSSSYFNQTLAGHTDDVVDQMKELQGRLAVDVSAFATDLGLAAELHDWGKAHEVFQRFLQGLDEPDLDARNLLAKSDHAAARCDREFFRHELASALAMIASGYPDLSAYLAAAHHGKVRMRIRSMPGEVDIENPEARTTRGIREGDKLVSAQLSKTRTEVTTITLALADLGTWSEPPLASWTERTGRLLNTLGPFRLAYLEMLLRVADGRASACAATRLGKGRGDAANA